MLLEVGITVTLRESIDQKEGLSGELVVISGYVNFQRAFHLYVHFSEYLLYSSF